MDLSRRKRRHKTAVVFRKKARRSRYDFYAPYKKCGKIDAAFLQKRYTYRRRHRRLARSDRRRENRKRCRTHHSSFVCRHSSAPPRPFGRRRARRKRGNRSFRSRRKRYGSIFRNCKKRSGRFFGRGNRRRFDFRTNGGFRKRSRRHKRFGG